MTSSTKPEVHNVAKASEEDRATACSPSTTTQSGQQTVAVRHNALDTDSHRGTLIGSQISSTATFPVTSSDTW